MFFNKHIKPPILEKISIYIYPKHNGQPEIFQGNDFLSWMFMPSTIV